MKLDHTVAAVVTGGASGLGAATVCLLRARGVQVAIFDIDEANGLALGNEHGASFHRVDVTSEEQVDEGFLRARQAQGFERILVNCAGTGNAYRTASRDRSGLSRHFPVDAFERVIRINLVGTFRCIAKSAAGMLNVEPLQDGERGCIVSTASIAAQDGQLGQAAYAASKAGVVGLTLPVMRDLMDEGIRVNTIMPGVFETPLLQLASPAVRAALAAAIPFPKRFGLPPEYASLVESILINPYLNGECIRLDGGLRMPPR